MSGCDLSGSKELQTHSQLLLEPVEVHLDAESCGVLLENAEALMQIGVKIEAESGFTTVTAFPTLLDCSRIAATVNEAAQTLIKGGDSGGLFVLDEVVHRIACRAAIKAGDKSVADDLEQLARRVLEDKSGSLRYCPHGRPIVVRLGKRDIEKRFRRVL
jgi:DNA mismatch repair protein MutL